MKGRTRLHPLADPTGPNVIAHELILADPVEVAAHCEICFLTTTMSTNKCVVVHIHDTQSQITVIWYDDTRRVAGNSRTLELAVANCTSIRRGSIH